MSEAGSLGVGILGAGFFGGFHACAIAATPGVRTAAVCAEQEADARAFAAEHGGTPYTHWRLLLADPAVDIVVIAAPHHLHHPMAVAAAQAGKHVLLEKPMARTPHECRAIIAAVQQHGVQLMVGHLLHFAKPCQIAQAIVESGEIGRPLAASGALAKLWMEPNRRDWHLDLETGGGMLMTAGIHVLDLTVWLMGGRVAAVSAAAGALVHTQRADDCAMLLLRFADGRFAQVSSLGYRNGAGRYGLDLMCERGTLRIDFEQGVAIGRDDTWTPVADSTEPDWMLRAVEREWQAMVATVRDGAPVPVCGAYAGHIVACITAALRSSAIRQDVTVDVL